MNDDSIAWKPAGPLDARIRKVEMRGVWLVLPDGTEGWLPEDEWSYDPNDWAHDIPRLKRDNPAIRVIPWGRCIDPNAQAFSRRRVEKNPWNGVNNEWLGQARQFVVTSLTSKHIHGEIEPGLKASMSSEYLDQYMRGKNREGFWKDFARARLGDRVAGIVTNVRYPGVSDDPEIILDGDDLLAQIESQPDYLAPKNLLDTTPSYGMLPSSNELLHAESIVDHILLVDDDPNIHEPVSSALQSIGYEVTTACSEQEASEILDRLATDSIQIALIDLHLRANDITVYDGLRVAKEVAARWPNCKIVLISAEEIEPENMERVWSKVSDNAGIHVAAYLQKPFTFTQLHKEIVRAATAQPRRLDDLFDSISKGIVSAPAHSETQGGELADGDFGKRSIDEAVVDLGKQLDGVVVHVFEINPIDLDAESIAHFGDGLNWKEYKHKLGKSPVRDTAIRHEFILSKDVFASHHLRDKHRWLLEAMNYRSMVGVPILTQSHLAYCLLAFHTEVNKFDDGFYIKARLCAEIVGRALDWEWMLASRREGARYEHAGKALAVLSHELGNKLSGASADALMLDTALRKHAPNAALPQNTTILTSRLCSVIDRAITISQTFHGIQFRDTPQTLNVIECLEEAIIAAQNNVPAGKQIEIKRMDLPAWECRARGDRCGLVIALFNIILNAIQQTELFVRPKGVIWVEWKLTGSGIDRWLKIDISDTGPGIHWADFERIFGMGYSTKPAGTGMGLDISRQAIQAIKSGKRIGNIEVFRSVLCVGSTISVRLPLMEVIEK